MAKGGRTKNKSKRSTIPRGIPQKRSGGGSGGSSNNTIKGSNNVISPFEYARTTNSSSRVKHHVHNKSVSGSAAASGKHQQSALAKSIARRKHLLKSQLETQHKSNEFVDRRIGEAGKQQRYNDGMYDDGGKQRMRENAMLKRIVAERVRRSKRAGKFSLEDDNDDGGGGGLTHRVSLCLLVESIYHIICVMFFCSHTSHSCINQHSNSF